MNFLQTLRQEFRTVFSDVAIVLTIIGGVILYSFLYPQPYAHESVSYLAVSVVDYDKSDRSRDLIFKLDATPQIIVKREDLSEDDAKAAFIRGDIKAIIVIPLHFKRDISLGKSSTIAVGADSSYFLIYGGILEAAMKSILTEAASIKIAIKLTQNIPLEAAKKEYTPYVLNTINLFNKENSYTQYVIPAVFVLILQQTMLIGLAILGGGVREKAYKHYNYDTSTLNIMASRFIIFFSIFFIHLLFYFGFSFEYFGITHLAKITDLLKFSFAFLIASVFFGIFLGSVFTSREIATPAVLFSSLPLVFSAGFVWPLEALPEYLRLISNFIPSTPAIEGFLKLNQMGASFDMILDNYAILLIQATIYAILGYYFINKQRKDIG
jgi:ABC-2 type transport system permease protein